MRFIGFRVLLALLLLDVSCVAKAMFKNFMIEQLMIWCSNLHSREHHTLASPEKISYITFRVFAHYIILL